MGERRGTKGLELWCRKMTEGYPGVSVVNMTTSWRNGLAFCAMIHHFRPDLIDFTKLNKDDIYYNNELAFTVAERHLGIPALLEPEDMVEFPVPDRLSILTYLSQFYQVFAVPQGKSPARIAPKRAATVPDHGIASPTSSSPPSKTAAGVGARPRRDPCAHCHLPVFIAERLNVGKALYHRTCFRCARCSSQLTLANFYETEKGAFCCETCPDEEASPKTPETPVAESSSIDKARPEVLSRSLSDEEKSASLESKQQPLSYSKSRSSFIRFRDDLVAPGSVGETQPQELAASGDVSVVVVDSLSKSGDLSQDLVDLSSKDSKSGDLQQLNKTGDLVDLPSKFSEHLVEQPPPLPTSLPPDLCGFDNSGSAVISSSSCGDNNNSNLSSSVNSDDSHSVVTKDRRRSVRSSLVRDRMRVFETSEATAVVCSEELKQENEEDEKSEETTVNDDEDSAIADNSQSTNSDNNTSVTKMVIEDCSSDDKVAVETDQTFVIKREEVVEHQASVKQSSPELVNYPDDLNPFGDDEEQPSPSNPFGEDDEKEEEEKEMEKPQPTPRPAVRKKLLVPSSADRELSQVSVDRVSFNPFEDDEDEEEEVERPRPSPRNLRKIEAPVISLNPFWTDGEEEEEEERETGEGVTPVPTPRLSRSITTGTAREREEDSSSSSVTSGSARKRKPAPPRPPVLGLGVGGGSEPSSLTSSPSQSVVQSPKGTPKARKSKKAPLPPTSTPLVGTFISPDQADVSSIWNEKTEKDELNRNKQILNVSSSSDSSPAISALPDKSTYGKWKRRKGHAPARPLPQKRTVTSSLMAAAEIRRELDVIEIQQQGLEKQGVRLEQIIRQKCEGPESNPDDVLPQEVEELILQLFELVNEKNELFRKQAELMYLKRQERLEEEHADVEYQIRCLMLQPEANKTDSDKAKEEELINRLVDIVERRNEIIECLEMDRVREAEEDDSISNQLSLYTLKNDSGTAGHNLKTLLKSHPGHKLLSLKHLKKKKNKKEKKSSKGDADKDVDESESSTSSTSVTQAEKVKHNKKKKKFNINIF